MDSILTAARRIRLDRIFVAIITIAVGILFVARPDTSSTFLCKIAGIVILAAGIISLIVFAAYSYYSGGGGLIFGMALTAAGIFCLVHPDTVTGLLSVIFGIFIIIDGANSISEAILCSRAHVSGWLPMLIIAVITTVLGFVVMFGTFDAIIIFAGVALIIVGVVDLVLIAVFTRRVNEARDLMDAKRNAVDVEE